MKKITLGVCLVFAMLVSGVAKAQLMQDFEGAWPPADWTIESTNAIETWSQTADGEGINGMSASVQYELGQNESLISPVFSLPVGSPVLKFNVSLSYYWSVDPFNNYDCTVSISDDGGFTWTAIWDETQLGVFTSWQPYAISIPLDAYAGQTNLQLKFNYTGDDGAQWLLDDISADLPPACAPVADLTNTSATMTTAAFSWTSSLTNFEYVLDNSASDPTGAGTPTTETTYSTTGLIANTTYYFHVRATLCADGSSDWTTISFTTPSVATGCLEASNGMYPFSDYTPETCDGIAVNSITTLGYAGEYSNVNVEAAQTYTFQSSIATDYITISTDDGLTATVYGPTPLVWVSTVSGTVRFYTHTDADCGEANSFRERSIICGVPTLDTPDFVNIQFPSTLDIGQGDSGVVYGQVYKAGLTDVAPNIDGQAPGIQAWVGISPIDSDTNPNTWTTWIVATHNAGYIGNNDEYQATIGSNLAPGTYYYVTRFRLENGPYVYGGTNDGAWDGITHLSGVLTIAPPPVPVNDECAGAIELIPGVDFAAGAITGTSLGASNTDGIVPDCQANAVNNVWYTVTVPASGNINIESNPVVGSPYTDSVMVAFSGDCGALVPIECDDDDSVSGFFSLLNLTGRTPGEVIYVSLWRYSLGVGMDGEFQISAYDPALATNEFEAINGLKVYPNPVKNMLNLSYTKNITNVAVYNIVGQQVITKTVGANQSHIDMSSLSAGTYMVKVTADNQVKTIKVIKE